MLAYTQLLIQQTDNRYHLSEQISLIDGDNSIKSPACCSAASAAAADQSQLLASKEKEQQSDIEAWFNCMWTSAKACAQRPRSSFDAAASNDNEKLALDSGNKTKQSRAARLFELFSEFCSQLMTSLIKSIWWLKERTSEFDLLFQSMYANWFARWRSPIIQRLAQSILVHVYFISALMLASDQD